MKKSKDQTEFTEETALAFFARHLDGLKWKYHRYPEKPVLYSGFNGDHVQWDYSLYARETGPGHFLLGVNSFIPTKTPADRRPAITELLTRINFDLSVGCFELDLADGEIRFRTSTILPGTDITPGIIEHLLRSNLSIVDERFPQIAAVLFSGASPEDALKPKESEDKSQPRFDFN
jgi:hypothetical protein